MTRWAYALIHTFGQLFGIANAVWEKWTGGIKQKLKVDVFMWMWKLYKKLQIYSWITATIQVSNNHYTKCDVLLSCETVLRHGCECFSRVSTRIDFADLKYTQDPHSFWGEQESITVKQTSAIENLSAHGLFKILITSYKHYISGTDLQSNNQT